MREYFKITLFGQSAGAQSTSIHLLSNDMQPYFTNAIVQSSPFAIPFRLILIKMLDFTNALYDNKSSTSRRYDEAMVIYYDFAKNLNCTVRDINCLRKKSVDEIITAQMQTEVEVTSLKFLIFFEPWLPVLDGKTIPGQLLEFEKWNLQPGFQFKPV